ncbi:uncharacterized protein DMAD_09958 [Drosophila madeirensis]|uniref:Uncharacterized protein n=1 Tax=Drosophila madeirensis TaxID=30013 RepID=A0AAU9F0F5_DROMD
MGKWANDERQKRAAHALCVSFRIRGRTPTVGNVRRIMCGICDEVQRNGACEPIGIINDRWQMIVHPADDVGCRAETLRGWTDNTGRWSRGRPGPFAGLRDPLHISQTSKQPEKVTYGPRGLPYEQEVWADRRRRPGSVSSFCT